MGKGIDLNNLHILMNKLLAFIKRDFLIQKSYRLDFILSVSSSIITIVTFYFIAKLFGDRASPYLESYGGKYFPYVLLGLAFYGYFHTALNSFAASIRREQMMGTLESILITPTKITTIILSSSIWNFLFTSINVIFYLFIGIVFLEVKLFQPNIIACGLILILTIICFASIGIISASFIMIFKRGNPITWFISTTSGLLGGVYFPIDILPKKIQLISHFIPITYSLRALRHILLSGYSLIDVSFDLFILFIFVIALSPLSIFIFKLATNIAKKEGSLIHY